MKKIKKWTRDQRIALIIGTLSILITLFIAIINLSLNGTNIDNSGSINSPVVSQSNNISINYENKGLIYKQVLGRNFSGESGEINRTVYIGEILEVYNSGLRLLEGVDWSKNEGYLKLHNHLWDDQIVEIGL